MHVPVWHAQTQALQEAGRVQMVGIIQEQHPDRCRLFMQWQRMGWPILVDSLNLLEVTAVPITLGIDEYGIIRHARLSAHDAADIEDDFLNKDYAPPAGLPPAPAAPAPADLRPPEDDRNADAWHEYANALVLWGGGDALGDAIGAYQRALSFAPDAGWLHFRLGVAYRKRYDSAQRQAGDFGAAVQQWSAALETDPNQYIWRRRIQQYGPRLDKPYPFYDWVLNARAEITARGEIPTPLTIEPGGAEFAEPSKAFAGADSAPAEPDAEGRIHRDTGEFIAVESTVVPDTKSRRASARVHVAFRPNAARKAHWNNEVDGLVVWVAPPDGWEVDRQLLTVANPPEAVSGETRTVEFEVRGPGWGGDDPPTIPAYALYYVCEDVDGVCMYRRQDLTLPLSGAATDT